jgi:predicted HTH transcriptional regulator
MLLERDRGFIVWGIEDKSKRKVGTTVRLKNLKKGNDNLENWLSHVVNPSLMMELLDFEEDGKLFSILSFEPTYTKPVKFLGAEYIRIGENVRSLKDHEEHERALWIATGRRKFESAVALPHQSAEEVQEKLSTETFYERSEQPAPSNPAEILRKFVSLGALREDMEDGYDITNLGALLFANDMTQFPSIASKSVRVIKYAGVDKRISESEVEGKKGYAVGFPGMLKYIGGRLPKEERYEKGVRKVVPKYSTTAVREILANALIHQDFTITGVGPVVEIYQDRLEVTNPGNSLVEVQRIIDERRSRNQKLAQAMRDMGLCEERGGGIDKAILEIEEMFLPAPQFLPSVNAMRVVLHGPRTFSQLSRIDKVWACYCHCVVRWIRQDFMSNTTLRERFSLTADEYQSASDVIANAKKEKFIRPADPAQGNRYAKYIPYWA